jgi:hypothetical protein
MKKNSAAAAMAPHAHTARRNISEADLPKALKARGFNSNILIRPAFGPGLQGLSTQPIA